MENIETYTERKNAFEKPQTWVLTEESLIKTQEDKGIIQLDFKDFKSIQLFYKPHRYRTYNYACRIMMKNGVKWEIVSTSYESFANFANQAESYTPFIQKLVKNVSKKNPSVSVFSGLKNSTFWFQYLLVFIILYILSSVLSMINSDSQWIKILMIGFYLIYIIKGFKKNFPKEIFNGQIPDKVLPQNPA